MQQQSNTGSCNTASREQTWCEGCHALGVELDWLVQLQGGQVDTEDLLPPMQVGACLS